MSLAGALLADLVGALLLTLAVELPVAALLGLRSRRALMAVTAVNMLTNPLLNLALLLLSIGGLRAGTPASWLAVGLLEGLALMTEWLVLASVLDESRRRLFGIVLAMNAASFTVGLAVLGVPVR